ncbi:MAG TPA: S8 family serine peptidase, partial [Pseudonocardiaceae bacterium]
MAPAAPGSGRSISTGSVAAGKLSPRLTAASGSVTVFVELAATPAVDAYNTELRRGRVAARAAASAARTRVDGKATGVIAELRGRDRAARELYRTNNAVPGVTVVADAASLRQLAANPDVRSIRIAVPKKVANSGAAVLTRVLDTWQSTGRLGDHVRVGIIDTGIDYTHANFGGPGTTAAYDAIDETVADPSYFPTAKVVGGYDFVGNGYDAGNGDPAVSTPVPDPNPLDCNGHGSHVAGTAAGFGVNADANGDGSTFSGDYAALTADSLRDLRIGPGMAPRALLYALKVFGCTGSTNVVTSALDWALDPNRDGDFTDHLDLVNLSLGSDYGAPDDPESLFVRKLSANGVLVVASAGNGGDLYDIGGSPGNAPEALTVASSRDAYVLRDAAEVTAPAEVAGLRAGQYSVNFTGYDTLDLTRAVARLSMAGNLDGCRPFSDADKTAVAGKFAWLEWDDNDASRRCGSGLRTNNAQAAGAAGVLLSSTLETFGAGIAGNATIPVFQLTGSATAALRPALNAGTLQVRQAGALRTSLKTFNTAIEDTPSSFTSRGVRGSVRGSVTGGVGGSVKPDVAAPGDTITSTRVGSG